MVISPPIEAANLGMADSLILMVLALVVFGPRRLPQIGRQIGKLMYEFRKASNDFKFQMEEELRNAEEADRRKREEAERQRALAEAQNAAAQAQSAAAQARDAAALAQNAAQAAQGAAQIPEAETEELTGLRVQPPTTGEQVAAARPGRAPVEDAAEQPTAAAEAMAERVAQPAAAEETPTETSVKEEVATEEGAATEPTAHHG